MNKKKSERGNTRPEKRGKKGGYHDKVIEGWWGSRQRKGKRADGEREKEKKNGLEDKGRMGGSRERKE